MATPRKTKETTPKPVTYITIDEFLDSAKFVYPELNAIVISGFKSTLGGKTYFESEADLKKKLDEYLGKSK